MNDFNFFVPIDVDIEKSKDPSVQDEMYIYGVASTNDEDEDSEVLEPSGYILDRFLSSGTINYEHLSKRSPKFIIGEPVEAAVKGNEMHIKAKIWPNSQVGVDVYNKIREMKENGSSRKAGFSIEGKALARDPMNPKRIVKALITNCAVTFSPVNGNTWADISKGKQDKDFVDQEYDKSEHIDDFLFQFTKNGKVYRVGKDYQVYEFIEKTMDVSSEKPLIPESLDKKVKPIVTHDIQKSIESALIVHKLGLFDDGVKNKLKNILGI